MTLAELVKQGFKPVPLTWEGVVSRVTDEAWLKRYIRRNAVNGHADSFQNTAYDCSGVPLEKLRVIERGLDELNEFLGAGRHAVLLDFGKDGGKDEAEGTPAGVEVIVGGHRFGLDELAAGCACYMRKVVASVEWA